MPKKSSLYQLSSVSWVIVGLLFFTVALPGPAKATTVVGEYCTVTLENLSENGILGADGKAVVSKDSLKEIYKDFTDAGNKVNPEHDALDKLLGLAQNSTVGTDQQLATNYLVLLTITARVGSNFFITPSEFLSQTKLGSDDGQSIRARLAPVYEKAVDIAQKAAAANDRTVSARKAYALALKELDLDEAGIFRADPVDAKFQKNLDVTKLGPKAQDLYDKLSKLVVGQPEVVGAIADVMQQYYSGLRSPSHPIGNILIMGPTGAGKTRAAEALAEVLYGDPKFMVKIDSAEFQHSHEIAKLIGSPPGYLGHRETQPALSQEVLNAHTNDTTKVSIVLFDEIEKASDSLWSLLLGITDKATLTLGDNRKVDFSNSIILMTSNVGASEMQNMLTPPSMGFASMVPSQKDDVISQDKVNTAAIAAMRMKFSPEFINRLDKVAVARFLTNSQYRKILDLQLDQIQKRINNTAGGIPFTFTVTQSAKDQLLMEGIDPKYGARPLLRTLEKELVMPFGSLLETKQLQPGDVVRVDYDFVTDKWSFKVVGHVDVPAPAATTPAQPPAKA